MSRPGPARSPALSIDVVSGEQRTLTLGEFSDKQKTVAITAYIFAGNERDFLSCRHTYN